MERADFWYDKMRDLNRSHGEAPHKPLLLLALLDLVERGGAASGTIALAGRLNDRFRDYARVVQHRREARIEAWLPFFHLRTQGFWETLDEFQSPTNVRRATRYIRIDRDFLSLACIPEFRNNVRRLLITEYFDSSDRDELLALCRTDGPGLYTAQP